MQRLTIGNLGTRQQPQLGHEISGTNKIFRWSNPIVWQASHEDNLCAPTANPKKQAG
jgi:hypothetical protein